MQIVDSELSVKWEVGAQIGYIDSVVADPSEGGVVSPTGRQTRPLMQATFSTIEIAAVWAMFGTTRSGVKGFFIRPPVERFKKVTMAPLGTATGASQTFQLQVSLGTLSWDALYPVESTIILYDNETPIDETDWSLGDDGEITLDADGGRAGHTIKATFEYKTAVRFVDAELQETVESVELETIQTVTVREVF